LFLQQGPMPPYDILQVDRDRLFPMGSFWEEANRGLDLDLGSHDAVHPQLATERGRLGSQDMALDRELVRECALTGLTAYRCIQPAPLVGLGMTGQRRLTSTGDSATRIEALKTEIETTDGEGKKKGGAQVSSRRCKTSILILILILSVDAQNK